MTVIECRWLDFPSHSLNPICLCHQRGITLGLISQVRGFDVTDGMRFASKLYSGVRSDFIAVVVSRFMEM